MGDFLRSPPTQQMVTTIATEYQMSPSLPIGYNYARATGRPSMSRKIMIQDFKVVKKGAKTELQKR